MTLVTAPSKALQSFLQSKDSKKHFNRGLQFTKVVLPTKSAIFRTGHDAKGQIRELGTHCIIFIDELGDGKKYPGSLSALLKLATFDRRLYVSPSDVSPLQESAGLKMSYECAFDRAGFQLPDTTPISLPMIWERIPFVDEGRYVCFFDCSVRVLKNAEFTTQLDLLDKYITSQKK